MPENSYTTLNDQDLIKQAKLLRKTKIYDALIFGLLIGVAIFSVVEKGFTLLMFIPLAYISVAAKNNKKRKEIEAVMQERGL